MAKVDFNAPIIIRKKKSQGQQFCTHNSLYADEERRMLECRICGLYIDPFDYLFKKAVQREIIDLQIAEMTKERERLQGEIATLKKVERNTKARIRHKNRP